MNTWRAAYIRLTKTMRQARLSRGITQAQAATRIGRSARTFKRFEAGEVDIQLAHLFALADLFGIGIDVTVLSPEPAPADMEQAG